MLQASRKVFAYENMIACDIAAVTICDAKYHNYLKEHFRQKIISPPELPKEPVHSKPVEGATAHAAVQNIFRYHKRFLNGRR